MLLGLDKMLPGTSLICAELQPLIPVSTLVNGKYLEFFFSSEACLMKKLWYLRLKELQGLAYEWSSRVSIPALNLMIKRLSLRKLSSKEYF